MTAATPSTASNARAADPGAVWRVINGYTAYWSVATAIELGVFDALAADAMDADTLAASLDCLPDRLCVLADALVGLGFLERGDDGRYSLTIDTDTFLVRDRPRSIRELVVHSPGPRENWEGFAATIRGEPVPHAIGAPFFAQLVRATAPTQHAAAAALAPTLPPYKDVLDLGAGAAPWTIALLEHEPAARATVNDVSGVAEIARSAVRERGVASRVTVVECDFHSAAFADAAYDVVVLGHVVRGEPVEAIPHLLARAHRALRPGGVAVVADYFLDDDRRGPLNALLLGATMAASVRGTATYTALQFVEWLRDAGFVDVERRQPVPFQDVMVASKPLEGA